MYKLSPFVLLQNLPSDVYNTQNIEVNSRRPENPFRSLGGVNRILENILNKLPYEGGLWFETALLVIYYQNP